MMVKLSHADSRSRHLWAKIGVQGISPMIWRRLLICGDSTISDLHYIARLPWDGPMTTFINFAFMASVMELPGLLAFHSAMILMRSG
jgi:hypothetical protein